MKTLTSNSVFEYIAPAPLNTKVLLLTHDNQCLSGVWKGPALPARNPQYKGWCGMPKRDKVVEAQLEYL